MFPAGVFVTAMVSDGSPSTLEIPVIGSSTVAMAATVPIVTTLPSVDVAPTRGRAPMSSAEPRREPTCTVRVWSFSVIEPAGRRVPLASRASRMSWFVDEAAASAATSGVMVMRCCVVPSRSASRTPLIFWMSLRVVVSSSAVRSFAGRSLVTAIWITGKSSMLPVTTCGSMPSGSVDLMRLIAWLTFCSAVARSVP